MHGIGWVFFFDFYVFIFFWEEIAQHGMGRKGSTGLDFNFPHHHCFELEKANSIITAGHWGGGREATEPYDTLRITTSSETNQKSPNSSHELFPDRLSFL